MKSSRLSPTQVKLFHDRGRVRGGGGHWVTDGVSPDSTKLTGIVNGPNRQMHHNGLFPGPNWNHSWTSKWYAKVEKPYAIFWAGRHAARGWEAKEKNTRTSHEGPQVTGLLPQEFFSTVIKLLKAYLISNSPRPPRFDGYTFILTTAGSTDASQVYYPRITQPLSGGQKGYLPPSMGVGRNEHPHRRDLPTMSTGLGNH